MRLTTKGRFAVTAMIDLALHQAQGAKTVTLAGISERQNISLSYLEQLFAKLRRKAVVDSVRGPGGGYQLARAVESISVADIVLAVDEALDATHCGSKSACDTGTNGRMGQCMTHNLWESLNTKMLDYLHSVSLDSLVQQEIHAIKHAQAQTITFHKSVTTIPFTNTSPVAN
jgi:Rrf2 family transcriptional regulator, iron-sulfur cluster assembly transcription factor